MKIYGAKVNGEVTGECRVDDVKSEELSRKVAEMVEEWDVPQFGSHKQFFFLRQAEETTLPYPYLEQKGREKLHAADAFPRLEQAETVELLQEGLPKEVVYKNQLADYFPLGAEFFRALREGEFGEDGDAIYREYVGYSATYSVIRKMQEKGSPLEQCRLTALLFRVGVDFEIR